MVRITIKGRDYDALAVKDSFNRRAQQYHNNIIAVFRKVGLTEDDFDISLEAVAFKKSPAYVSWYIDGRHLYFSYNGGAKFVDNLYVVWKVLDAEFTALLAGEQTITEFTDKFAEERDIAKARVAAREALGLPADEHDLEIINAAYKKLANVHHPDRSHGDMETFKKINNAHKLLKRELQ
jgi:hypothetical protein